MNVEKGTLQEKTDFPYLTEFEPGSHAAQRCFIQDGRQYGSVAAVQNRKDLAVSDL